MSVVLSSTTLLSFIHSFIHLSTYYVILFINSRSKKGTSLELVIRVNMVHTVKSLNPGVISKVGLSMIVQVNVVLSRTVVVQSGAD